MIVLDVVQGSPEWRSARLGIPTSSAFHRILTPRTLKPSSQQDKYLCELVAARMLGYPLDDVSTALMQRGGELEAEAANSYEFQHDVETKLVGFVLRDDRRVGCSPDRFVGSDGLLEIKCTSPAVHVGALLGMATDEHRSQCQGQLWLTGRAWVDLMFYHPDLPPALVRVERSADYIAALSEAVEGFLARLEAAQETLDALTRAVVA